MRFVERELIYDEAWNSFRNRVGFSLMRNAKGLLTSNLSKWSQPLNLRGRPQMMSRPMHLASNNALQVHLLVLPTAFRTAFRTAFITMNITRQTSKQHMLASLLHYPTSIASSMWFICSPHGHYITSHLILTTWRRGKESLFVFQMRARKQRLLFSLLRESIWQY